MAKKKEKSGEFEFTAAVTGLEFRDSFSPSESLDGMLERMEERIKKVRKIKKNNIFVNPFKSSEN
jgi:hypothetical protein